MGKKVGASNGAKIEPAISEIRGIVTSKWNKNVTIRYQYRVIFHHKKYKHRNIDVCPTK